MKTACIVRRSFIAMFWGWAVCIVVIFLVMLGYEVSLGGIGLMSLFWMIYWLLGSAFVILGVWLFIFLPADLWVKESSFLRSPEWAGACGCMAGFMSVYLPFILSEDRYGDGDFSSIILLAFLAAICGLTASLHLVLHHPRKEQPSPQSRDGRVPASLEEPKPNDL